MSKYLLEQLYKGEIFPSEKIMITTSEYLELNCKISDEKKYFEKTLSSDEWSKFEKLEEMQMERLSADALENFIYGFRLGAKMMLAMIDEEEDTQLVTI